MFFIGATLFHAAICSPVAYPYNEGKSERVASGRQILGAVL